jgi:hypothetical protein
MPLKFAEADLLVIGKIQEARGCTIEHAKAVYRERVNKLANPDIENRAEIIQEVLDRQVVVATDEEVEASMKPKKKTMNERRLEKRAAKEAKEKVKKTKAKKAPRKAPATSRVECELVPPSKEVELTEVSRHVYTANLFGKKHATLWAELDHAGQGVKARFGPVDISQNRLELVEAYAKENSLPIAVCVTVRVGGRLDQGYAVPLASYGKFKSGRNSFTLSGAARKAYGEEGWAGVKFNATEAKAKAA